MFHVFAIAAVAIAATTAPARINGHYVEVRNCDVWTGPCFANAEGNISGKNGAMVWNITTGSFDGVQLDGLTIVAAIQASDTLGFKQTGPTQAILFVDGRANAAQQAALVKLAKQQAGDLLKDASTVQTTSIKVFICGCQGEGCAVIEAGPVKIKTRCLDAKHDRACGNETAFYPPLTPGVHAVPAVAEHAFNGNGLPQTWFEAERRGAYVGTFSMR